MLGVINSFLVFFEVVDDFTFLPALIVEEVRLCTVLVIVVVRLMVDSIEFDCLYFVSILCLFCEDVCVCVSRADQW